jgi:two-component system chemotaxis response regulator CheY
MRILIVEDEPGSRLILERFLGSFGECHHAADGEQAVQRFLEASNKGEGYDLICLDIQMPKMNGFEVLRAVREHESNNGIGPLEGVKIVMTTQADEPSDVLGAFKSGCEAYVVKPIERATLLKEVSKLGLISEEQAQS